MAESLLDILKHEPAETPNLPPKARRGLLEFLLRWEGYGEALACLGSLSQANVRSSALLDQQSQALAGAGRHKEAIKAIESRLKQDDDLYGWLLYGRILLDARKERQALKVATQLTKVHGTAPGTWSLLGDVQRARRKTNDAQTAYLEAQKYEPEWAASLIGLMQIHLGQGDTVTATAYAVRAYAALDNEYPIPADEFQQLLDYFGAVNDTNWIRETSRRLKAEFDRELREVQELLGQQPSSGSERSATNNLPPTANSNGSALPPKHVITRPSSPPQKQTTQKTAQPSRSEPVAVSQQPSAASDNSPIKVSAKELATLTDAAKRLFGFDSLRPPQDQIMTAALRGENVLAILPTGAGKSLCYQLLAFLNDGGAKRKQLGTTLVISPLIALMKDQIDNLPPDLQAQTVAINSSMGGRELNEAIERIAQGGYRLVYAAPERLRQLPFLHALREGGIERLVIDEAHCVSVWGHDFRPDYLHVAQAHKDLGAPTIMALTATAPTQVRHDIQRQLFGTGKRGRKRQTFRVVATDTFRKNLTLSAIRVANKQEKTDNLITLCRDLVKTGSGIVYARSRKQCEEIAALLRGNGIKAQHYHAGLSNRAAIQEQFMNNEIQVVVATIAFGMGVDKSDIRFVLHHGLPDSVESYYQEAGRAGRDRDPSRCVLLYTGREKDTMMRWAEESVVSVEHLRQIYQRVKEQLGRQSTGLLELDELGDGLKLDRTQLRVALSMLEEVGLIQRHYDAPRSVSLMLTKASRDRKVSKIIDAANLKVGRRANVDYMDLAQRSDISPITLEEMLLKWQSAGKLTYDPRGRTPLVSRGDSSAESAQRVDALLDQYATIQRQRVTEIVGYANATHCRHGHLAGYLGGEKRSDCGACDICNEKAQMEADPSLPGEEEQLHMVLVALNEGGWGWRNLNRLLRGDPEVNQRGQRSDAFGQLHFRSESSVEQLVMSLMRGGYIAEKRLSHGGVALGLTQRGTRAVRDGQPLGHVLV